MVSRNAISRLNKELAAINLDPPPYISVAVDERNIYVWHYLLEGPPDSPYEGGWYHGYLHFPEDYPFSPPEIRMLTPTGRFQTNFPLCLSISSYHPETWNPAWSVGTILTGLLSFMLESIPTYGCIETSDDVKRQYASQSMGYNLREPAFVTHFPDAKAPGQAAAASEAGPETGAEDLDPSDLSDVEEELAMLLG